MPGVSLITQAGHTRGGAFFVGVQSEVFDLRFVDRRIGFKVDVSADPVKNFYGLGKVLSVTCVVDAIQLFENVVNGFVGFANVHVVCRQPVQFKRLVALTGGHPVTDKRNPIALLQVVRVGVQKVEFAQSLGSRQFCVLFDQRL